MASHSIRPTSLALLFTPAARRLPACRSWSMPLYHGANFTAALHYEAHAAAVTKVTGGGCVSVCGCVCVVGGGGGLGARHPGQGKGNRLRHTTREAPVPPLQAPQQGARLSAGGLASTATCPATA